eukprot:1532532-Amphidinium_carterae.1
MMNLVKAEQGGNLKACNEDHFIDGRVQLACYLCWIKATNDEEYKRADGSVSSKFRNMGNLTKPGAQDAITAKWLKWRVGSGPGQVKVDENKVKVLSQSFSGCHDWVTSIADGRVAVLYACATPTCKAIPMKTNGWVFCRKSLGSKQTQWHCPACGDKFACNTGLANRLLVVYGDTNGDNVCYRWGHHELSSDTWAENVLDYLRK